MSISSGFHTSGLGAAAKQRQRGEGGNWVAHPLTENDYTWLRRTVKGWTRKKMAYHGLPWPPQKGWRQKLLSRENLNTPPMTKPAWHYAPNDAERERLEMKRLYQEKSGDYSY